MNRVRNAGLTVVEVLVALVILAVGVAGAVQLQAVALRMSSQAESIKTSTQVAEGEIEWRRQTEIVTGAAMPCASYVPDGYACDVTIEPCNAVGANLTLTCEAGLASPVAYRITVEVQSPRTQAYSLSTVTTGSYVAGVVGDGTVTPPDEGGGTEPPPDEGGGEEPPPDEEPPPAPCIRWNPQGKCTKYGS